MARCNDRPPEAMLARSTIPAGPALYLHLQTHSHSGRAYLHLPSHSH